MPVIQHLINSELLWFFLLCFVLNRNCINLVYGDFSQEKSVNSLKDCIYKTCLSMEPLMYCYYGKTKAFS